MALRRCGRAKRGRDLVLAVVALAAAGIPGAASARWLEAQTPHFEIYSDGDQRSLENYATKLEVFDHALRVQQRLKDNGAESGRLKFYLVSNHKELRLVWPTAPDEVLGFYSATQWNIFAVGMRHVDSDLGADDVILHEYVHHFMLQNYAYAYASWMVEGFAEYYMTAKITDQEVIFGNYNKNRAEWLMNEKWIPLDDLLSKRFDEIDKNEQGNYYPQAWLLTHYMLSDPKRREQLDAYVRAVGRGQDSVSAMTAATGMTTAQLTRALYAYTKVKLSGTGVMLSGPRVAMSVTALPPSADDLLLEQLQVAYMGDEETSEGDPPTDPKAAKDLADRRAKASAARQALLADIRQRTARYPGDRLADLTLAEAEIRIGDRAAGEALLKRRLDADPTDVDALWLSGFSRLMTGWQDEKRRDAQMKEARLYLVQAFKLDPQRYPVIYASAQSREFDKDFPNENSLNCLILAHELAPQVDLITIDTGHALLMRGRRAEGVNLLTIVANDPHGGWYAQRAAALLKSFEAKTAAAH